MGISGRLYDGVIAFAKAVAGREKVDKKVASLLGGTPASWRAWSGDPYQQIIEYRNWTYTAIRFRALRRQVPPIVARYVDAGEIEGDRAERRKAFTFGGAMPKKRNIVSRQKAIGSGISRVGHELEYLPTSSAPMRLLHDPNDPQIGIDLWYMCSVFEDLTGRVHIWKVRDGAGRVVELWYLPTQWCDPRPGDGKLINQLLVTMPSGGSVILDADDVITIGEPSPFGYLAWQSPLQAHGLTVDLNNALFVSRFNGLINGSHVGSMIKVPSSMANNPDSMARLEQSLLSRTVGTINYNRPLIAEEGAELINLTPQMELAFSQSANQMRDNIFAAFDLDASVMGYANEATYAASVVTQKNVFNKVVKPYWERRNATLTEKLLKMEFGLDLCAINEHKTEETPDEKERRLRFMKESGAISVNEIRVEYEKEPYDDPRYDEPIGFAEYARLDAGNPNDAPTDDYGQTPPSDFNGGQDILTVYKSFTGVITDAIGRKIRYVNGKRVPMGGVSQNASSASQSDSELSQQTKVDTFKTRKLDNDDIEALNEAGVIKNQITYDELERSIQPSTPSDLDGEYIYLWHGTSSTAARKIAKDGTIKEGERGRNATADVNHAAEYPESTGADCLVLIKAKVSEIGIDPNDTNSKIIDAAKNDINIAKKMSLFPESYDIKDRSSCSIGSNTIVAIINMRDGVRREEAFSFIEKGNLMDAIYSGATVEYLNRKETK
jgi:hypothetical protein